MWSQNWERPFITSAGSGRKSKIWFSWAAYEKEGLFLDWMYVWIDCLSGIKRCGSLFRPRGARFLHFLICYTRSLVVSVFSWCYFNQEQWFYRQNKKNLNFPWEVSEQTSCSFLKTAQSVTQKAHFRQNEFESLPKALFFLTNKKEIFTIWVLVYILVVGFLKWVA